MGSELDNRRKKRIENPTLDALAPEELQGSVPAAERWILTEIKKMQLSEAAAASHRRKAMAGIAERFQPRLFRYCLTKLGAQRQESEDIVQEVLQDLEKLLERVENEEHLRNLLFRLAKNKCVDAIHRSRRLDLSDKIYPIAPEEEPEMDLDPEILREAIRRLPKLEDRILLTLSLDYHLPLRQIALILEISEGACKMRRHRSRLKLKHILERGL